MIKSLCNSFLQNISVRCFSSGMKRFREAANYYDLLGVNRNCSSKELKAAYVKLCKEHHPDKKPNDPNQHKRFVALNEAYNVLSKPETRNRYDVSLNVIHQKPLDYSSYRTARRETWRDETIWSMRDKTQDKYYQNRSHNGPFGNNVFSHQMIVTGCVFLVFTGVVLHLMFYNLMAGITERRLREKDIENFRIYSEVRSKAMEKTNEEQLKKFLEQCQPSRTD